MNDAYLLIFSFIVFAVYFLYANTKALIGVSKCFTDETRKVHNFKARLKALMLPKSMWIDDVKGEHVPNLLKANEIWQQHTKLVFASIGALFTIIFIIMLPNIYYVYIQ